MMNFKDRIWGRRVRGWIKPIQSGLGVGVELRISKNEAFVKAVDGFEYVFDPDMKFAIPNNLLRGDFSIDLERIEFVKNCIPKNGVVIDAGAGIGDYSMYLSKLCKEVHSFEPMARSFDRLKKNIERNNIKNVFINKLALWDKTGQFGLTDLNVDYNSIVPVDSPKTHEIVGGIRLDEYLTEKNISKIDFIIADIQGAELLMIRGLGKYMDSRPALLIEVHPESENLKGYKPQELFDYLFSFGYSLKKEFGNDFYFFECK